MKATTRQRAARAVALLKQLSRARLRGSDLILPDGTCFSDRAFDDCFESGDGDEVVVLIMLAHRSDPELQHAFQHGYARDFVATGQWTQTLAAWEARQPGLLPLE